MINKYPKKDSQVRMRQQFTDQNFGAANRDRSNVARKKKMQRS